MGDRRTVMGSKVGINPNVADYLRRAIAGATVATRGTLRGSLAVGGLHKPVEWLFWFGNDLGRRIRYGEREHLYGIRAYCGLFGQGKTISMVEAAKREKDKYGDKLSIWSNVPVSFADGPIRGYRHMIDCHQDGRNHLFLFDEIHLSWEQQEWKHIDPDVLTALTQQRKWGGGFACYYTTQRLIQTAVIWRRLAEHIVDCKGWPSSRWIHQSAYAGIEEYNEGMPRRNPMSGQDQRNVAWKYSFIAEDTIRYMYRTDWVAKRLTADGEAGIIGEQAVQRKVTAAAHEVREVLAARAAADGALAPPAGAVSRMR